MYGQVVLLENKFSKKSNYKDMDEVYLQKPVGNKLTFQELKVDPNQNAKTTAIIQCPSI